MPATHLHARARISSFWSGSAANFLSFIHTASWLKEAPAAIPPPPPPDATTCYCARRKQERMPIRKNGEQAGALSAEEDFRGFIDVYGSGKGQARKMEGETKSL